jgi:hypothetical protein
MNVSANRPFGRVMVVGVAVALAMTAVAASAAPQRGRGGHRDVRRGGYHRPYRRPAYGYGVPAYGVVPPPVVYGPPMASPGINLLFNFR